MRYTPKPYNPFQWLPWFAWRPVTLQTGQVVWLETVERRMFDNWGAWWEYR